MKNKLLRLLRMVSYYSFIGMCLQVLFIHLIFADDTVAQKSKNVEDVVFNLRLENANLEDALKIIEAKTKFHFTYDQKDLDSDVRINFSGNRVSLKEVLLYISKEASLGFRQINYNIDVRSLEKQQKINDEQRIETVQAAIVVTGKVTSAEDNEGLPGVNIVIKGTSQGTVTDIDGMYKIEVPSPEAILVFTSVGFLAEEIKVENQTTINVSMTPDITSLNEIVVIGYGTQKKADLTGAVSTVDVEETIGSRPVTDLARGLQGSVPGLTITTPSGEIGTNPNIRLRGMTGSLNSTSGAQPLILLDNVEIESLQMVNPNDIESISVLKDAASTSIYGTRAAWGVILITTKSGKKNTPNKITYSNNFSISTPTTKLNIAPAAEGAEMAFSALQRTNPSTNVFGVVGMYFDEVAIQKMRDWEQQYGGQDLGPEMVMDRDFEIRDGRLFFYRSWDAGDMFLKDWAPQQKHDLTITGGGEKTSYHLGLGYLGQTGVLKVNPDKWERYNVTLGVNSSVNNWLDARGKIIFSRTDLATPFIFSSATYDPWYYLYRWPRTYPYGTYEGNPFRSAVTEVEQAKMTDNTETLARISVGGTVNILEGLTLDADYTYSNTNIHSHRTGGGVTAYNFWAGGGELNYSTYTSPSYNRVEYLSVWEQLNNVRAYLTYQKSLANHSFKIMGGTDAELFVYTLQESERRDLLDPDKGELDLATGDQYVDGNREHWATQGFFGRIDYSFDDKFLLQLNGRYGGSSRFPASDRWAFFPSLSAGYVLSNESFLDAAAPVLSFLKLRGSWGSIGNQDVGNNAFIPTMSAISSNWLIGNNLPTFTTPGAVSRTLTWETVTTLDFGLDAGLFNDQVNVTFDWYQRTTSDMLSAGITLPSSFGTSAPRRNFGEMQTTGWELAVTWNHTFNNGLYFSATGMLSDFQEKITKYANTVQQLPNPIAAVNAINGSYYEGMVLGEIWGYETDRFFTEDDFVQDANGELATDENGHYILKEGVPSQSIFESGWFFYGPGDVKYKDLNGDGEINYGSRTADDHGDMKVIGNSTPRYQYGLRLGAGWKGFDLDVFVQGVGKRGFWASGPIFIPGYRPGEAWYDHHLDYWTPENPDAFYPRPTDHGQSNEARNFLPQTKYLLDLAYLRMKNITLGYTLPQSVIDAVPIERFRLYVSGENLFEFENVDIPIDPEMDYTTSGIRDRNTFGRVYPYRRTLSFGLEVTF